MVSIDHKINLTDNRINGVLLIHNDYIDIILFENISQQFNMLKVV